MSRVQIPSPTPLQRSSTATISRFLFSAARLPLKGVQNIVRERGVEIIRNSHLIAKGPKALWCLQTELAVRGEQRLLHGAVFHHKRNVGLRGALGDGDDVDVVAAQRGEGAPGDAARTAHI